MSPIASVLVTCPGTGVEAFNRFEQARRDAGVTAQQVHQPIDDDQCIVVDLDFRDDEAADGFKSFLEEVIWQTPDMSPGLAGTPRARLLREVRTTP